MKSILVTNIKGGVAKSSTAVAVAAGLKLAKPESSVLLIDGDPQGSIKTYFGLKLPDPDRDFSSFLIDDINYRDSIQPVAVGDSSIDEMVTSRRLSEADIRMAAYHRREETLRTRFKRQKIDYDFCVIDSGPAMNLVLLNFMTFADEWLIPATMDAFAISNISYLFEQKTDHRRILRQISRAYSRDPSDDVRQAHDGRATGAGSRTYKIRRRVRNF